MVTKEFNSLDFNLKIAVPETVEEYDRLAKKEGSALSDAIFNVLYRGVFAKFRAKFAEAVENNTGIVRNTEVVLGKDGQPKKDDDGNEVTRYTETEKVYLNRVYAILVGKNEFTSPEAAAASFAPLAQSIVESIVFDPSETEREPSQPKKVAKAYITIAEKAAANGKLESLALTLTAKLGNWKVEPTVDSVAKGIAEDQRRINAAKNLAGAYGVE